MRISAHTTRCRCSIHPYAQCFGVWVSAAALVVLGLCTPLPAEDDLSDLLQSAKPAASAPATLTSPTASAFKPTSDALGTLQTKAPAGARLGTITLNNSVKLEGRIWTTLDTPLRVWSEETKSYRDVDLALVKAVEVHVLAETMEDDWRWLKEGSDQKVFSGKKYPNVDMAYRFTLLNDQVMEGTVVAPIYFVDGAKSRTLALYKHYKGNLDETLKDLVYITSITLTPPAPTADNGQTTHLPLLPD
jgi:hypothetical protein